MKVTATMDSDGRIKLPRKVKECLKLQPGSRISLSIEDATAHLNRAEPPLAKVEMRDGYWVIVSPQAGFISDDDVVSAIQTGRDERETAKSMKRPDRTRG
jgi:bifunctional DNA-binding transcriptional regulator/antitoxin component of YhaV-PrlF toxin-antitoxin module